MPFALDAVDYGVRLPIGLRVDMTKLGVEVRSVVGHVGQRVVDLVIACPGLGRAGVLDGDSASAAKRHEPEAVQAAVGIDGYGQRVQADQRPSPSVFHVDGINPWQAEEVRHWAFDRRLLLLIPIHAQDEIARDVTIEPHALNGA